MLKEKNNIWDALIEYFQDDREDCYATGASDEEISEAENVLKLQFSSGYKKFLNLYGGAAIGGELLYGLRYIQYMSDNLWSIVDITNFYKQKQKWPDIDDWYVISDDGRGNPIGCKPDGSVWLSDHDSGFEQIKLANDFEEYVYKLLTDTLYE